ncbi:hypothetical protein O7614_07175 [Micromonospora sp. WMMD961]|uniref:hypothetical protein n=1 Tax=Micromonospora sp. WMMD961 TaxID=3016100 RepID=UPI0024179FFC|nr:hypothetical protein [Micromonospora sp. WMMD961]MDG4779427.1 hypothetical protein [Micromonospora sp. WMMD961]
MDGLVGRDRGSTFWTACSLGCDIERGRGDLTLGRIVRSWASWRGRAVEPVVREALRRLPGADETVPAVAVSRSGTAVDGFRVLSPEDLLAAYRD